MDLQSLIYQWQSAGIFDYLLPFLLVFAFVFGILQKTEILGKDNKSINILLAVVVGFLVLQLPDVPLFFRELFPRLGIGLAVLFSLMILVYLFVGTDQKKGWDIGLASTGAVIGLIVIFKAFDQYNFGFALPADQVVGWIVGAVLLIGIIIAIASSGPKTP